eukprot:7586506-Prorocentrum_lima.AAC.1
MLAFISERLLLADVDRNAGAQPIVARNRREALWTKHLHDVNRRQLSNDDRQPLDILVLGLQALASTG